MIWFIDGNNVFGSRPDGWWNDRGGAMVRFTQCVAEWCRTHHDAVVVVFDQPVPEDAVALGGGNLRVIPADRRGRNAADDTIVRLTEERSQEVDCTVVTSDKGLRENLDPSVTIVGVGAFRTLIQY